MGDVFRVEAGALDKIAEPALEVRPDDAALEDAPTSGKEPEGTVPDLGCGLEPEEFLSTEDEDALLLLAVACRILLFSSLTILSLSSRHCLSLACLSLS